MTVPTAGYLGLTEAETLALMGVAVTEDWTLSPEALAAKARRQRRDPHGRWTDVGLVPAAVGRRSPGWMKRDLSEVQTKVEIAHEFFGKRIPLSNLREIGQAVDKVAKRYSRGGELRAESEQVNDVINDLFDAAYKRFAAAKYPEHVVNVVEEYLTPEETARYNAAEDRHTAIQNELESADAQAYLAVLRNLRPMGGELKRGGVGVHFEEFAPEELLDIEPRLADALAEVSHVLPTAWIEEMNAKGEVSYDLSTKRAQHELLGGNKQVEQVERLIATPGYTFAGYEEGLPVIERDLVALYGPQAAAVMPRYVAITSTGEARSAFGDTPEEQVANVVGKRLVPGPWIAPPPERNSRIRIDPQHKSTLLHEIGHRVEAVVGEEQINGYTPMMNALLSFLRDRRGEEEIRPLSELTKNDSYEDHERAFADEFFNAYIGKDYGGRATEVLTMGLQNLFYPDWRQGMAKDTDMRHFILGLLAAA